MDNGFLATQTLAVLGAHARDLHVSVDAFATNETTFVERAAESERQHIAVALTAALGSVVSVAPGYLARAEAIRPKFHYEATRPGFLGLLAKYAEDSGFKVAISNQEICWALREVLPVPQLPADLRFELRDAAWMNTEQLNGRFENGVGGNRRASRNKFAVAIYDRGEPIAVGGVHDTFGLDEIGVDVLPSAQATGLGTAVVAAAVHAILDRGGTPFYGCAADNIRSQRTARSVGFVPVFAAAFVSSEGRANDRAV